MPRVSVVIPTYNYARYLPETIDSVLAQTYADREIIVIDDGSTDGTPELLRRYGDRLIFRAQENVGLPSTRNRGCALARGEYIAFLDADDSWFPDKLEKQVRTLDENPAVGMACAMMSLIDGDGTVLPGLKPGVQPGESAAEMLERGTALPSSWLVRRSCFESLEGFDENLIAMEDYEFALRMAANHRVICSPDIVGKYRVHADSLSHDGEKMILGYLQSYTKLLDEWDDRHLRTLTHRKRARYRYRMAKIKLAKGDISSARRLITEAITEFPLLAWQGGRPASFLRRATALFRPYFFLFGLCVAPDAVRFRAKNDVSY